MTVPIPEPSVYALADTGWDPSRWGEGGVIDTAWKAFEEHLAANAPALHGVPGDSRHLPDGEVSAVEAVWGALDAAYAQLDPDAVFQPEEACAWMAHAFLVSGLPGVPGPGPVGDILTRIVEYQPPQGLDSPHCTPPAAPHADWQWSAEPAAVHGPAAPHEQRQGEGQIGPHPFQTTAPRVRPHNAGYVENHPLAPYGPGQPAPRVPAPAPTGPVRTSHLDTADPAHHLAVPQPLPPTQQAHADPRTAHWFQHRLSSVDAAILSVIKNHRADTLSWIAIHAHTKPHTLRGRLQTMASELGYQTTDTLDIVERLRIELRSGRLTGLALTWPLPKPDTFTPTDGEKALLAVIKDTTTTDLHEIARKSGFSTKSLRDHLRVMTGPFGLEGNYGSERIVTLLRTELQAGGTLDHLHLAPGPAPFTPTDIQERILAVIKKFPTNHIGRIAAQSELAQPTVGRQLQVMARDLRMDGNAGGRSLVALLRTELQGEGALAHLDLPWPLEPREVRPKRRPSTNPTAIQRTKRRRTDNEHT
ncbi:hypothetical protein AB0N09_42395 [Streptomyces erythrochromogenes]|uniref:hypothetical protein n=1 Tax=Streptomyces erythrochromogenes TaxID=285574 RepID=UPI00341AB975